MTKLKPEHQAVLDDPNHKFNKLQKKYNLLVKRLEEQETKMNELLDMVEYWETQYNKCRDEKYHNL